MGSGTGNYNVEREREYARKMVNVELPMLVLHGG